MNCVLCSMWLISFLLTSLGLVSDFTLFFFLNSPSQWLVMVPTLWVTLAIGMVMTKVYCIPLSFAVQLLAPFTSQIIGRDLDNSLPHSLTQSPSIDATLSPGGGGVVMCLKDVPHVASKEIPSNISKDSLNSSQWKYFQPLPGSLHSSHWVDQ